MNVRAAGSQLRANKAACVIVIRATQSQKLLFLSVTRSTPISIKISSCVTVTTGRTPKFLTYQLYSSVMAQ